MEDKYANFTPAYEVAEDLKKFISEGNWDEVIKTYKNNLASHTQIIEDYEATALHVAVDMDEVDVALDLLGKILKPEGELICYNQGGILALEMGNKEGDTPLHYAASRGITKMCVEIIGRINERKYLASQKNKHGETPLFQAAINDSKDAFAYLSNISDNTAPLQDLVRNDGDTILHCAIRNEYFDLAVIILHYYDFLSTVMNRDGEYPLNVLATRPSAFESSTCLSLWKRFLYRLIHVEQLDAKRTKKQLNPDEVNYPKNYTVLIAVFTALRGIIGKLPAQKKNQRDLENPSNTCGFGTRQVGFLPPNYETIQQSVKYLYDLIFGLLGVQDIMEVTNTKRKHQWARQVFKKLMERPDEALTGSGSIPTDIEIDLDMYNVYSEWQQGESSDLGWLKREKEGKKTKVEEKETVSSPSDTNGNKSDLEAADKKNNDKKETAFFAAARNGIVEMVNEILSKKPMVIRETNLSGDNVLLVAVRNRKPLLVKSLEIELRGRKSEVWKTLTLAVDKEGKTLLHLAADAPAVHQAWQISGAALQHSWDVNWYQYIKTLVPQHYCFMFDKNQRIPSEIFKKEHEKLRNDSNEWLRQTSESCSVVAALVAGATFATAATFPGGPDDNGLPHLKEKPAFHAFVVSSSVGLGFSLTGLIMFLTILTSRKLHRDFRKDLPIKLLLGLSSLFVSIVALLVSFCTGHSFLFNHKYMSLILPIYVATFLPVTFYALAQLPLYLDLLTAVLAKVPRATDEGDSL